MKNLFNPLILWLLALGVLYFADKAELPPLILGIMAVPFVPLAFAALIGAYGWLAGKLGAEERGAGSGERGVGQWRSLFCLTLVLTPLFVLYRS